MGDTVRAIGVLEPVARANPNDVTTQLSLADLYSNAGRKNDAERIVRQLVSIEPGNADALNYLGYLLADSGRQLDEAIRLVRRALDLEPNNPNYLDSLGWAYYRRGDYEEAEKYLAPAAQQMPRNATVQEHYGDVLAKRGRWQDAIAAWTRALQGDEGDINKAAVEKRSRTREGKCADQASTSNFQFPTSKTTCVGSWVLDVGSCDCRAAPVRTSRFPPIPAFLFPTSGPSTRRYPARAQVYAR